MSGKALAMEATWIVAGQALALAASLALVRVLTEALNPRDYGELTLALTAASFLNQVLHGGIVNATGRFYSVASERDDLGSYMVAVGRLLLIAGTATVAFAFAVFSMLTVLAGLDWALVIGAALTMSAVNALFSTANAVHMAARRRLRVALHVSGDAWLKVGCILLLSQQVALTPVLVLLAYVTSTLLALASHSIFLVRGIRGISAARNAGDWMRELWTYAMPFCLWGSFTWLHLISDRWALQSTAATEEVGRYAVLFQLGYTPIITLVALMSTFLGPIFFQMIGDGTDSARKIRVNSLSIAILLVALGATALAFLTGKYAHDAIFRVIVAEDYRSVSPLLPWMMLAGGLFASGQVVELRMMSELRSSPLVRIKIGTSLVGVAANVVGALLAGATGLVFAFVVFSTCYLFAMVALGSRELLRSKASMVQFRRS